MTPEGLEVCDPLHGEVEDYIRIVRQVDLKADVCAFSELVKSVQVANHWWPGHKVIRSCRRHLVLSHIWRLKSCLFTLLHFQWLMESSHYGEIHDKYSRASNTMTPIVMIPGVSMVPTSGLMPSVMHPTTVLWSCLSFWYVSRYSSFGSLLSLVPLHAPLCHSQSIIFSSVCHRPFFSNSANLECSILLIPCNL